MAVCKGGFASFIILYKPHILYKMRDSSSTLDWLQPNQNRICPSALGQRRKGSLEVTLGTIRNGLGGAMALLDPHYLKAQPPHPLNFEPSQPSGDGRPGRPSPGEAQRHPPTAEGAKVPPAAPQTRQ
jgi:hypothetical protein